MRPLFILTPIIILLTLVIVVTATCLLTRNLAEPPKDKLSTIVSLAAISFTLSYGPLVGALVVWWQGWLA